MKNFVLIIFYMFSLNSIIAQTDSSLIKRLNKPINNCETIAINSQELLVGYSIDQFDSINKILSIWSEHCGNVEPVQRVKILVSIYQNQYNDSDHIEYMKQFIDKYKDRVSASADTQYYKIYEYNKVYFDYVPLNSEFEGWTRQIASNLKQTQKHNSPEYMFCLLFTDSIQLFDDAIKKLKSNKSIMKEISEKKYHDLDYYGFRNFTSGIWVPVGKLSRNFKPSPQIGFSFGFPLSDSFRFDFGIMIAFLINDDDFDINVENSIKSVNGDACITAGGWLTKEFEMGKSSHFGIVGGIGYATISTDLKKPDSNSNNNGTNSDDDSYYEVGTFDCSIGTNIRTNITHRKSIGLNCSYHFAPYYLNKILVSDLGSQFFSTSLSYRF